MASLHTIAFPIIILVLQSWAVTSFNLSPVFNPIIGSLCKSIECGKGTCKASNDTIGYVCECEPGWKQPHPSHDDLKFLPCVIPNCTLNSSCVEAPSPSPAPPKLKRDNILSIDPCHWADCGGGTCKKTSSLTYKCECNEGYFKLLNASAFPCFKQCALGADCLKLGINITNISPSPPPSHSQATSLAIGDLKWMILIVVSLAVTL